MDNTESLTENVDGTVVENEHCAKNGRRGTIVIEQHLVDLLACSTASIHCDLGKEANLETTLSKLRLIKNLVVLCLSFILMFSAFLALQSLQSTINREQGLGTAGLSLLFFCGIVSGLFLPPVVIARLGCKWTMVVAMSLYVSYLAAGFHATWATILPTSALLGFGAANLWSAQMVYISALGAAYANKTGTTAKLIMNRFTGIFFSCLTTGNIFGNLVSSQVMSRPMSSNVSMSECGSNFCPLETSNLTALAEIDEDRVHMLAAILLATGCSGVVLMAIFLDGIQTHGHHTRVMFSLATVRSILKHIWQSRTQKLLLPVTIYRGVGEMFFVARFTAAFVGCAHGVGRIGYVMIAYGLSASIFSTLFGYLANRIGVVVIFLIALLAHLSILVTLLTWNPAERTLYPLFIMAAVWAMGDTVFRSVLVVTYSRLFEENPVIAFTTLNIFHFLGCSVAFAYSGYICTFDHICITMVTLTIGVTLTVIVKVQHRHRNK